jgi:shikimate kinase
MERTWILVGMMGVGKSSLGRALAEAAQRQFDDTDAMLQRRFGRTVTDIFRVYGEETFRDHETSLLRSLEPGPFVLATGGGIVLRDENWSQLRRLGYTLYLRAKPETLIERLDRSVKKRPLLAGDDWQDRVRSILESRQERYALADDILDVDGMEAGEAASTALAVFQERAT